jgi:hypothetical protein
VEGAADCVDQVAEINCWLRAACANGLSADVLVLVERFRSSGIAGTVGEMMYRAMVPGSARIVPARWAAPVDETAASSTASEMAARKNPRTSPASQQVEAAEQIAPKGLDQ